MKRHKYQLAALMISVIIATGSLSGSVFAAETSGDTTESSVVEVIEETDESETADEGAGEGSETESEQETEKPTEDTSQETEGSVDDTETLDEKEEDYDQSVPEDTENNTEEEKTDSSADTVDTPAEETDTMDTSEEGKEENQPITTVPSEQENISTESMNSGQEISEEVVDSGSCGENAIWILTGTDDDLTLTISGSGTMANYTKYKHSPWYPRNLCITRLIVEDGITGIGDYSFAECSNLTSVTMGRMVKSIGKFAFSLCNNLSYITIPDSLTLIDNQAFYDCGHIDQIHIESLEAWLKIIGPMGELRGNLYLNDDLLTDVLIPDGVSYIRVAAFSGCHTLKHITLPEGVTSIDVSAFYDCRSLTEVIIPKGVTFIGSGAFSECSSLTSITIPDGVTAIEHGLLSGCSSLTSVTIPDSVTIIDGYAFSGCSSLTSITIPDGVTAIEYGLLSGCSSLTSVTIPDSVTIIDGHAFSGCSSLTSVTIPDGVTRIEEETFSECSNLTSVTIPDSVTSIGNEAFKNCSNLTSITIPDGVTVIGRGGFVGCNSLTNIIIPDGVTYIGSYAFYNSKLKIYFRGTDVQWGSAVSNREIEYSSIFYNYFSVDASFELSDTSFFYTGKDIRPLVTVTYNGDLLVEGEDYELLYKNNTNVGTATVTITGEGNYSGTAPALEFIINPASIETAEVSDIEDRTYRGSAQTQTPVVKLGSTTLTEGTDYTVSYSNNTNVGTATLNITGIGNYTGEISKTFTILKADQNLNVISDFSMILVNKTTNVSASGAKETSGYTFSSSDPAVATIDSTGTVTGKAAGTVTITVSTAETPNYKAGSKTVDITVNEIVISGYSDKIYNGQPQTPTPVVKLNGTALTEGIDYSISYSNNVNAGKATMTIKGIGRYEGITTSTFFTIAKAAQNFTVKAAASSINVGKTTKVTASGAKETPKYTFTSSNTKIATVDASGTVTGKAAGTVTITVKAAATANYNAASKTVKITVTAPKTLKKPGNCHFTKWNNSKYTGCRISWNKVDGAEGYQTLLSWTDGSHSSATIVKSNVLYRDCTVHPQHVSQMKVRAFYTLNGQRKYGPWSNVEYITPSPAKLTTKNASSGSNLKMNISWNIIYGCNGYNVFITTNPNGKWYWNQSTTEKATATSASIDKCGGAKLKKNTRYYVRIVTRRKRNGVFCTVPMPANNTYIGSFVIN